MSPYSPSRRQFLVQGLRVSASLPLFTSAAGALVSSGGSDRVLVVLQLGGGNDALNMVVPHRQDDYYRLRPNLGLARSGLHALDDDHGLHPSMGGLGELYQEGRVAVVHGVGYPNPDRSHFRSMEIWHTADPVGPVGEIGWMGRLADRIQRRGSGGMTALHIGDGDLPLALRGEDTFAPTVRGEAGFRLGGGEDLARYRDAWLESGRQSGEAAFLRDAARTTYDAAERMATLADRPGSTAYPSTPLARRLRLVARLVAGGFGTRVFHVSLDGFDTHARQAGAHAALMDELSGALAAFQRDLEEAGVADRVATLVFSEFGRRVAENGSKGTDHGAAAPVLLVGSRVRAGMHGRPPRLDDLVEGDIPPTTDFRSVYAGLEDGWMGCEPSTDLAALPLFG